MMSLSQTFLAFAASLLVAAGQAVVAEAQVLNTSVPTTDQGVQSADAQIVEEPRGILPASWPSLSMPKLTLPKVSMPKLSLPKITMPKWPKNEDGTSKSPLAPLASGVQKVSAGTKKAWQGTKEIFSGDGDQQTAQPAPPSKLGPSFWDKLRGKQPEPEGPRTVAEFMSQPRLNP